MTVCGHPDCAVELPPRTGRGRPVKFCPEHAQARKREQDRSRFISREPESMYEGIPQCCVDWRLAGNGNRRICPQHKTWRAFIRQSRDFYRTSIRHNGQSTGQDVDTIVSLIETGRGVRVSADPDSWKPVDRDDKKQDKDLADWISRRQNDGNNRDRSRV